MSNLNSRFDRLEERLFGTGEELEPGILVRMDRDIQELKGNPAIRVGRGLRVWAAVMAGLGAIIAVPIYLHDLAQLVVNAAADVLHRHP